MKLLLACGISDGNEIINGKKRILRVKSKKRSRIGRCQPGRRQIVGIHRWPEMLLCECRQLALPGPRRTRDVNGERCATKNRAPNRRVNGKREPV